MSADPIKYTAIKFPAPVCDDCNVPMITVTSVFRHAIPHVVKIVSYQCEKCGCTLGAPRRRGGRDRADRLDAWPPSA
jgi:predicted RNA-binding protein with PUA domain